MKDESSLRFWRLPNKSEPLELLGEETEEERLGGESVLLTTKHLLPYLPSHSPVSRV
jgi:hypothetical protein